MWHCFLKPNFWSSQWKRSQLEWFIVKFIPGYAKVPSRNEHTCPFQLLSHGGISWLTYDLSISWGLPRDLHVTCLLLVTFMWPFYFLHLIRESDETYPILVDPTWLTCDLYVSEGSHVTCMWPVRFSWISRYLNVTCPFLEASTILNYMWAVYFS
jgi:hypothetical protein